MKKLNKIGLINKFSELNMKEMKSITGSYGYIDSFGTLFRCSCTNGANPPYRSSWQSYYLNNTDMSEDLNRRCVHSGTCVAISS